MIFSESERGKELKSDQRRWDERFKRKKFAFGKKANPFLRSHITLLPRGRALDLASGEGRNAVFLAQHGFSVKAVDISKIGLRRTRDLAKKKGVSVHTSLGDLDTYQIEKGRYHLITNLYFLNRSLIPKIIRGLRKGGMVIFETYLLEHRRLHTGGPKSPKYFLKPNELLRLFKRLRILFYREGIFEEGGKKKAIASLIAQKA